MDLANITTNKDSDNKEKLAIEIFSVGERVIKLWISKILDIDINKLYKNELPEHSKSIILKNSINNTYNVYNLKIVKYNEVININEDETNKNSLLATFEYIIRNVYSSILEVMNQDLLLDNTNMEGEKSSQTLEESNSNKLIKEDIDKIIKLFNLYPIYDDDTNSYKLNFLDVNIYKLKYLKELYADMNDNKKVKFDEFTEELKNKFIKEKNDIEEDIKTIQNYLDNNDIDNNIKLENDKLVELPRIGLEFFNLTEEEFLNNYNINTSEKKKMNDIFKLNNLNFDDPNIETISSNVKLVSTKKNIEEKGKKINDTAENILNSTIDSIENVNLDFEINSDDSDIIDKDEYENYIISSSDEE